MKPKYNLFSNTKYALDGIAAMLRGDVSFRIELAIIAPLIVLSLFLAVDLAVHLILVAVLGLIIVAECVNSAIEACVDLISPDFHPLAKIAKDCASAAVFCSVIIAVGVWFIVLFGVFFAN